MTRCESDPVPGGRYHYEMTMTVEMPEPEDPDTFTEQAAAGLSSSLATMDELVSGQSVSGTV